MYGRVLCTIRGLIQPERRSGSAVPPSLTPGEASGGFAGAYVTVSLWVHADNGLKRPRLALLEELAER